MSVVTFPSASVFSTNLFLDGHSGKEKVGSVRSAMAYDAMAAPFHGYNANHRPNDSTVATKFATSDEVL